MNFKSLLSKIDSLQEGKKESGSFERMQRDAADRVAAHYTKPAKKSSTKKAEKSPDFDTSALASALGGKLPKKPVGTVSKIHKTPDFEPDDDDGSEIVRESADPITQLAMISDKALDDKYHYGLSSPGNTFGWQANMASAEFAKRVIDSGETDIEKISDAIHKGWWSVAQKFVDNPDQFSDTQKLRQDGKFEKKMQQRIDQMKPFSELTKDQQDIDRVVARALLNALTGNQQNVAEMSQDSLRSQPNQNAVPTWKVGDVAMYRGKQVIVKDPNYHGRILVHEPWQSDNERGGVYSPASPDQLQRVTEGKKNNSESASGITKINSNQGPIVVIKNGPGVDVNQLRSALAYYAQKTSWFNNFNAIDAAISSMNPVLVYVSPQEKYLAFTDEKGSKRVATIRDNLVKDQATGNFEELVKRFPFLANMRVTEEIKNIPPMIAKLFKEYETLFDAASKGNVTTKLKNILAKWGGSSSWGENQNTRDSNWISDTLNHLLTNYYSAWKSNRTQDVAEGGPGWIRRTGPLGVRHSVTTGGIDPGPGDKYNYDLADIAAAINRVNMLDRQPGFEQDPETLAQVNKYKEIFYSEAARRARLRGADPTQAELDRALKKYLELAQRREQSAADQERMDTILGKARRGLNAMSENVQQSLNQKNSKVETKRASEWLKDPRLGTQVLKLELQGYNINNSQKGIVGTEVPGSGLADRYYNTSTIANNPMYFEDFLKYIVNKMDDRSVKGFIQTGSELNLPPRNLKEWMNRVEGISEAVVPPNAVEIPSATSGSNVAGTLIAVQGNDPTLKGIIDGAVKDKKLVAVGSTASQSTPSATKPATTTPSSGTTTMSVKEEEIDEVAAPGQEGWIKKNKERFIKQYGKKKGLRVLYAKAWDRSKGKTESINESVNPIMDNDALESIRKKFPHECKMYEDGWGVMDEGLYEALRDHYFENGFIPRKVMYGDSEHCRKHVMDCYNKDRGLLMDEGVQTASSGDAHFGPLEEVAPLAVIGRVSGGALARGAASALGVTSNLEKAALSAVGRVGGSMAGNSLTDMISDRQDESLYELEDLDDLSSEEDADDVEDFPFPNDMKDEDSMSVKQMDDMKQDDLLDEEDYIMEAKKKNVKNKHTKVLESEHYLGRDNLDITDDFDEWSTVADGFRARIVPTANGVNAFGPNGLIGSFDNKKQKGWIVSDIDKMDDDEDVITNKYGAGDPLGAKFPDPDLLESKKKKIHKQVSEETKETKTGRVHKAPPGGYGRKDDEDDEGNKVKKDAPKRGRGRPRKDADSETGEVKKWDTETLARWIVGSKPDKLPGKPSVKHKIKDESAKKSKKMDAQMESWDRELKSLLNEGMTITTSTGQPGGMDSVSVSATDSDAQTLLKLLQHAGIGLGGKSSDMSSSEGTDGQSISVEPVAHDEVMGQLQPEEDGGDDALGFIKRMLGARGGDSMSSMEMDYESEADHDHAGHDHDESCEECGHSPCACDEEEVEEGNAFTGALAKARADGVQKGEKMKVDGKEYPVKHGKKMDEEDEHDSDDHDSKEDDEEDEEEDKDKVDEGQQTCNECGGAMYEGHQCDSEKLDELSPQTLGSYREKALAQANQQHAMSGNPAVSGAGQFEPMSGGRFKQGFEPHGGSEAGKMQALAQKRFAGADRAQQKMTAKEEMELNEWANSPMGRSADEDFKTEIEYMTKLISGGLNGQKRDQTTLPHTMVKADIIKEDISSTMKKLAGIK